MVFRLTNGITRIPTLVPLFLRVAEVSAGRNQKLLLDYTYLRGQRDGALARLTPYQATHTKTVALIEAAAGRVQVGRVEVQEIRAVAAVVAVRRPTPVVAVRATTVRGRAIEIAGVDEIVGEASKAIAHNVTSISGSVLVITGTSIPLGKSTIFLSCAITTR